ncbi:MAG TPA: glycosyltransferase family 2 protein [Phnomibacter sp.]|nr:glycosyltransferase family 2 protein [Phnomibacter sp.]
MHYRIALVTINLNNCAGLQNTIASVAIQTLQPWAYVVIDGSSTDESVAVIKQHKSITHWVSEPDKGIYEAQNKGWQMVNAHYYLFLNSGDTLANPDSLATLAGAIRNKKQIIYGNLWVEQPDGSLLEKIYPAKLPANYFDYESLPHPATLISRHWLQQLGGYDDGLSICADWKFFRAVFFCSRKSFTHVNKPVSNFAWGGLSSLLQMETIIQTEKSRIKAEQPAPKTLRHRLSSWLKKSVVYK